MAMEEVSLLSFDNAIFAGYAFYTALLLAKMLVVANLGIPFHRVTGHVYMTSEDYRAFATPTTKADMKMAERIELLRRIVANDLENILPFCIIGAFYVLLNPPAAIAMWHFRAFAGFRLLHTFVYMCGLQPARFLCFLPAALINGSMVVQVLYALSMQ